MSTLATQPARASGEFAVGGDLPIVRLGYGTMQIPGPGVWGEPRDHDEIIRVLRRALELGVTFMDTADSYGPGVSERLIHGGRDPSRQSLDADRHRPEPLQPL
jgi:pyridoxine 4-dehydrogenase